MTKHFDPAQLRSRAQVATTERANVIFTLQTSRESLKMELLADVSLLPGEERIIGKCECSFISLLKIVSLSPTG